MKTTTLRVTVDAETAQAAKRIGRDYAGRRLETVLAAFVADLAVAADRPGSWEAERVGAWLASHVWTCEPADPTPAGPRLRSGEVMDSAMGAHPWDGWETHALAEGVSEDLANLGRAVIREAWQHAWSERAMSLCGWCDDGRRMLRLAQRNPELARRRWERLLETDGGRFDPPTGEPLGERPSA